MPKRFWTVNKKLTSLTADGAKSFDLSKMTEQAETFARLYGVKQILADAIAGKGEKASYTMQEQYDLMAEKYEEVLCNEKCEILRTDKGFTLRDPDKVVGIDPLSRAKRALAKMSEEVQNLIQIMVDQGVEEETAASIADKNWGERMESLKAKIKELESK